MNNLRQVWAKIVDDRLRANIQDALSDDLLRAPYKGRFLTHKETGENIDLTSSQFKSPVPYEKAIGKGFLTKQPSKRAQELIHRVS